MIRKGQEIFSAETGITEIGETGLQGVAGSPGRAAGVARVIQGPEDFAKLKKGEILVAPITNPVWTPLFAIASAVVTEVGGILSHGAIVAREYGIPAVMSVAGATRLLQDGQLITVDGNKGLVYLEKEV
jgi:pyruvate,water dikinase